MTLEKMLNILLWLNGDSSVRLHGSFCHCSGGGELMISFNSQPERRVHQYLLKKGFIFSDGDYFYRPIARGV